VTEFRLSAFLPRADMQLESTTLLILSPSATSMSCSLMLVSRCLPPVQRGIDGPRLDLGARSRKRARDPRQWT
jgi:hypothetical protein